MRKVEVTKWKRDGYKYVKDEKGNCVREFDCIGTFHAWGIEYEEGEYGYGNFSTAIVELDNGQIVTPAANMIRFLD